MATDTRRMLERWARRGKSEHRLAVHSRIILDSADGVRGDEIAARLKLSPWVVSKWRKRFVAGGLLALRDAPRSGAPVKYDAATARRCWPCWTNPRPPVRRRWASLARWSARFVHAVWQSRRRRRPLVLTVGVLHHMLGGAAGQPVLPVDVSSLDRAEPIQSRDPAVEARFDEVSRWLDDYAGWRGPFVRERWREEVRRSWARHVRTYRRLSGLLARCRRLGVAPALVTCGAHVDFTPAGAMADACRHRQIPVGEIVHGGNILLNVVGEPPFLLITHGQQRLFTWSPTARQQYLETGIGVPLPPQRCLGSLHTAYLLRKAPASPPPRSRPCVLYAPTCISAATMPFHRYTWDDYCDFLLEALALLEGCQLSCRVSLFDSPEYRCLDLPRRFRRLAFEPFCFGRRMWEADYLITDGLTSPIFEALITDKPILFYTGASGQQWDADFLRALHRRAICFDHPAEYLKGLAAFVADPAAYVAASGTDPQHPPARQYGQPAELTTFWTHVADELRPTSAH